MNISIDVNFKASEELTSLLMNLAAALSGKALLQKEKTEGSRNDVQVKKETGGNVTLEQVREKLSKLSQNGKQVQVKALIEKFGVRKLTEVPAEKYGELLKEANKL